MFNCFTLLSPLLTATNTLLLFKIHFIIENDKNNKSPKKNIFKLVLDKT